MTKSVYVLREIACGLLLVLFISVAFKAPYSPLMHWLYGLSAGFVVGLYIYKDIKRKWNGCDCE